MGSDQCITQRSPEQFPLAGEGTQRKDPRLGSVQWVKDFRALNPNWDPYWPPTPAPMLGNPCWRGRKTIKARGGRWLLRGTVPSWYNMIDRVLTHWDWQHTQGLHKSKPDKIPAWRKAIPPLTRSYLWLIPTGKGKINFLQLSVTGCINHTPKQAPWPGVGGQHTMDTQFWGAFCLPPSYGVCFFFVFWFLGVDFLSF